MRRSAEEVVDKNCKDRDHVIELLKESRAESMKLFGHLDLEAIGATLIDGMSAKDTNVPGKGGEDGD